MELAFLQHGTPRKVLDWIRSANFSAAQIVLSAFVGVILLGALLLMTPFATAERGIRFMDAVFTMTSAVCVTGLIVLDTPKDLQSSANW